jgi:hypothetical protein
MVLGQALAVFQAFSLAKLRNLRLLSQKLKFWESLYGDYRVFQWFALWLCFAPVYALHKALHNA